MNHLIRGLDGLEQLNATHTSFILDTAADHLRQLTGQLSGYRGDYRRTTAQYVKEDVTKILKDALAKCGRIQRYACKDNSKEKGTLLSIRLFRIVLYIEYDFFYWNKRTPYSSAP